MEMELAVRRQSKARIGLTGPAGSGKTLGALFIAAGLGGRVGVIDTERGSASLYVGLAGVPVFSRINLEPPYSPERFIQAIDAAGRAGIQTLIVDSITHEWNGIGGCLEINDVLAGSKFRGNGWAAWNETTPRHRRFVDKLIGYDGDVIVTMRSKTETAQEERNGKKTVVKLGMKAEQRDGIEFELTTVLDIVHAGHFALASKDRTGLFTNVDPEPITPATGEMIRQWLDSGSEPEPDKIDPLVAAIAAADSLDSLRAAYEAAVTKARADRDATLLAAATDAKDARKAALMPPDAPANDPTATTTKAAA